MASHLPLSLSALGLCIPLGRGKAEVAQRLFAGSQAGMVVRSDLVPQASVPLGTVVTPLAPLPRAFEAYDSRNNRLLAAALAEIADDVARCRERFGPHRIAVIVGTSTSGIGDTEPAYAERKRAGAWPEGYRMRVQEYGDPAQFVARSLGLSGPTYAVSTACSSSAKVFAVARRLIGAGLCDAAVVGGADALCGLTVNGFDALESLSRSICNPMSVNRDGINVGEGAALFLITRDEGPIRLLGVGESSDAHHVSAPDPEGHGAREAMRLALSAAGMAEADVDYINLHGTATPLNDAMEARAVTSLFGFEVPCSSTKPLTGHMLGAAGAAEVAILWLTLMADYSKGLLPPHCFDGQRDPAIEPIRLVSKGERLPEKQRTAILSNSFAFGGSNASVLIGTGW